MLASDQGHFWEDCVSWEACDCCVTALVPHVVSADLPASLAFQAAVIAPQVVPTPPTVRLARVRPLRPPRSDPDPPTPHAPRPPPIPSC